MVKASFFRRQFSRFFPTMPHPKYGGLLFFAIVRFSHYIRPIVTHIFFKTFNSLQFKIYGISIIPQFKCFSPFLRPIGARPNSTGTKAVLAKLSGKRIFKHSWENHARYQAYRVVEWFDSLNYRHSQNYHRPTDKKSPFAVKIII